MCVCITCVCVLALRELCDTGKLIEHNIIIESLLMQCNVCTGVEMLNGAMEKLYKGSQSEKWAAVTVSIAPSTISITEQEVLIFITNCNYTHNQIPNSLYKYS